MNVSEARRESGRMSYCRIDGLPGGVTLSSGTLPGSIRATGVEEDGTLVFEYLEQGGHEHEHQPGRAAS